MVVPDRSVSTQASWFTNGGQGRVVVWIPADGRPTQGPGGIFSR
jgi:hypothetical protein